MEQQTRVQQKMEVIKELIDAINCVVEDNFYLAQTYITSVLAPVAKFCKERDNELREQQALAKLKEMNQASSNAVPYPENTVQEGE